MGCLGSCKGYKGVCRDLWDLACPKTSALSIWELPKRRVHLNTQYRPPHTVFLIIGTPQKVLPNFGK